MTIRLANITAVWLPHRAKFRFLARIRSVLEASLTPQRDVHSEQTDDQLLGYIRPIFMRHVAELDSRSDGPLRLRTCSSSYELEL